MRVSTDPHDLFATTGRLVGEP